MIRLVILACLLLSSSASAEPGFALAVNNPMMWRDQESIGGSLYYRFARKQFIRLNVAHFEHAGSPMQHAIGFARDGYLDDGDGRYTGRSIDLGVGWMYFPRRAFDGPSVELGVLWREEERRHPEWSHTHNELARALVGWSVLWREHMFASVAAGGSAGRANGTEFDTHRSISRWTGNFEGYVRIGVTFGN